ncbi:MAG: DegV family EDD domain-containing protein [Chlorobi bacterium]|nr:DegV family EDD domain-containing protein [Chlorobiota bacterium]
MNKINVFPVPDGDTGTNLASTMRSIIDTVIPTDNIQVTAIALADAALVGARGNSGIIFAQFLYGFSNEIENEKDLTIEKFAIIVRKAVRYAYEAIANPVEGTMITVMRDWADSVYSLKDKIKDFNQLISRSTERARQALRDTPKQLEVLAKANVVDAGGKGFVLFLEGMIDFFKHGQLKRLVSTRNVMKVQELEDVFHDEAEITFRYCTEALITFDNPVKENKDKLSKAMEGFGDSQVIAGSPKKLRLHIHTDEPAKLFYKIKDVGNITYKKVDDMLMQNQIVNHRKWETAIITDSTSDIPRELIEKYQIHVVPLSVHFEKDFYLDSVTITPDEFYDLLESSDYYPSTSQPTYKDFTNKYDYLSSHYKNILGIHISDKLSGTWNTSRKAGHLISERNNKEVSVFSSKKLASGLGLQVLRAAKEIENGKSYEDITAKMDEWISKTYLLASTKTLKYMIKGGRVSAVKGFFGKLLGVQPIVVVNKEGKTELFGKPKSQKQSMKMLMDEVKKMIKGKKVWGYAISHAKNLEGATSIAKQMEELTGLKPEFISGASPVLGTHTGAGVIALSWMFE